jgi:hypothetical protein
MLRPNSRAAYEAQALELIARAPSFAAAARIAPENVEIVLLPGSGEVRVHVASVPGFDYPSELNLPLQSEDELYEKAAMLIAHRRRAMRERRILLESQNEVELTILFMEQAVLRDSGFSSRRALLFLTTVRDTVPLP